MSRPVRRSLLAALACVVGIVALGVAADDLGPIHRFDLRAVLRFEHRADRADSVAEVLVHLGNPLVFVVLSVTIVASGLYLGRRRESLAALAILSGANLSTQILKIGFENPHLLYEPRFQLTRTNGFPARDSFPSGHMTAVASLVFAATFVAPARRRLPVAAVGLLAIAAVGLSVIVLGWHFPTDVIGGLLVAAAWAFGVLAAYLGLPSPVSSGADDRHARQCIHE
jgi:membrane-associated phospholipid phosphatase